MLPHLSLAKDVDDVCPTVSYIYSATFHYFNVHNKSELAFLTATRVILIMAPSPSQVQVSVVYRRTLNLAHLEYSAALISY